MWSKKSTKKSINYRMRNERRQRRESPREQGSKKQLK